jgi:hypothetical protein
VFTEQVIRPTGLLDPPVEIRPVTMQVDDLLDEVRKVALQGNRVLVTVLTFCEITVRETPTQGLTEALSSAWHSPEVQALIQNATGVPVDDSNAPLPVDSSRQEGKKMTWCVWQKPAIRGWTSPIESKAAFAWLRVWTPAWPQAPPGPPPRVA